MDSSTASDQPTKTENVRTEKGDKSALDDVIARWSFACGVGIFILNMMVAWWVVGSGKSFISDPLAATKQSRESLGGMSTNSAYGYANQLAFVARMTEMDAHLKSMANQQTVVIIGMASSFSLLAIGFSLLIMGIRSAFQFSGQAGPNHQLVLSASSPGLLCFLLAAIIMVFALSRPIALRLGAFTLQADELSQPNGVSDRNSESLPTSDELQNQLNQATQK